MSPLAEFRMLNDKIDELEAELSLAEKIIKIQGEALEFYADGTEDGPWYRHMALDENEEYQDIPSISFNDSIDCGDCRDIEGRKQVGGSFARQAIKEVEEIRNEQSR